MRTAAALTLVAATMAPTLTNAQPVYEGDECPITLFQKATPREDVLCECYAESHPHKGVCCPDYAEQQLDKQTGAAGLLNFVFDSPTCVAGFRSLLCAQVCHPDLVDFMTVGEPLTGLPTGPKYEPQIFAGFDGGDFGVVSNTTFNVCERFCDDLYDDCRSAKLMFGETVGSQLDKEELCKYLSSDNGAKQPVTQYTLAPQGTEMGDNAALIDAPWNDFRMVTVEEEANGLRCWAPMGYEKQMCGGGAAEGEDTSYPVYVEPEVEAESEAPVVEESEEPVDDVEESEEESEEVEEAEEAEEEPVTEEPVTEEPVTEEPGTEEPTKTKTKKSKKNKAQTFTMPSKKCEKTIVALMDNCKKNIKKAAGCIAEMSGGKAKQMTKMIKKAGVKNSCRDLEMTMFPDVKKMLKKLLKKASKGVKKNKSKKSKAPKTAL